MLPSRVSVCQMSLPDTQFEDDIEMLQELGITGISLVESKLPNDDRARYVRELNHASIETVLTLPRLWTILPPLGGAFAIGPTDPEARVEEIADSITSLASFRPMSIMVCTGPRGEKSDGIARSIVVQALRSLAGVAAREGLRLSFEPMRESFRQTRTIISSLREAFEMIDEIGARNVGIVFDIWHLWDSPEVFELLRDAVPLIHAVQVADYRKPTRGPVDRVFCGNGIIDIARFLRELRLADFTGWYDLETLSDDGRYGANYPDSLWKMPPRVFLKEQLEGFQRCQRLSA